MFILVELILLETGLSQRLSLNYSSFWDCIDTTEGLSWGMWL